MFALRLGCPPEGHLASSGAETGRSTRTIDPFLPVADFAANDRSTLWIQPVNATPRL